MCLCMCALMCESGNHAPSPQTLSSLSCESDGDVKHDRVSPSVAVFSLLLSSFPSQSVSFGVLSPIASRHNVSLFLTVSVSGTEFIVNSYSDWMLSKPECLEGLK